MSTKEQKGLEMRYFILKPNKKDEYGAASRIALDAYATRINPTNPKLAEDIRNWVTEIRINNAGLGEKND